MAIPVSRRIDDPRPLVSVLDALAMTTETFTGPDLWEMLQFPGPMRVDMAAGSL
jgi:hypothetical protein